MFLCFLLIYCVTHVFSLYFLFLLLVSPSPHCFLGFLLSLISCLFSASQFIGCFLKLIHNWIYINIIYYIYIYISKFSGGEFITVWQLRKWRWFVDGDGGFRIAVLLSIFLTDVGNLWSEQFRGEFLSLFILRIRTSFWILISLLQLNSVDYCLNSILVLLGVDFYCNEFECLLIFFFFKCLVFLFVTIGVRKLLV